MKPRWMRINLSCPDCGWVIDEENIDNKKVLIVLDVKFITPLLIS